jgi:hypothetical protein
MPARFIENRETRITLDRLCGAARGGARQSRPRPQHRHGKQRLETLNLRAAGSRRIEAPPQTEHGLVSLGARDRFASCRISRERCQRLMLFGAAWAIALLE